MKTRVCFVNDVSDGVYDLSSIVEWSPVLALKEGFEFAEEPVLELTEEGERVYHIHDMPWLLNGGYDELIEVEYDDYDLAFKYDLIKRDIEKPRKLYANHSEWEFWELLKNTPELAKEVDIYAEESA